MSTARTEQRLAALEAEVQRLKRKVDGNANPLPWWEQIAGRFANDPLYDEAMRLGRKYRESLRPKPARRRRRRGQ